MSENNRLTRFKLIDGVEFTSEHISGSNWKVSFKTTFMDPKFYKKPWIAYIKEWKQNSPSEFHFGDRSQDKGECSIIVNAGTILRWSLSVALKEKPLKDDRFLILNDDGSLTPCNLVTAYAHYVNKPCGQPPPQPPAPTIPTDEEAAMREIKERENAVKKLDEVLKAANESILVSLKDFSTADLIQELKNRGIWFEN